MRAFKRPLAQFVDGHVFGLQLAFNFGILNGAVSAHPFAIERVAVALIEQIVGEIGIGKINFTQQIKGARLSAEL